MTKPNATGTCFIVHTMGDSTDTWSRALDTLQQAIIAGRKAEVIAPGRKGQLHITEYKNRKVVHTYDLDQCPQA